MLAGIEEWAYKSLMMSVWVFGRLVDLHCHVGREGREEERELQTKSAGELFILHLLQVITMEIILKFSEFYFPFTYDIPTLQE